MLLIAYEYPPILSAQSIRWYYLSRELRRAGLRIDVLTVNLAVEESLRLPAPEGVNIYRIFAGPFVGAASRLASRAPESAAAASHTTKTPARQSTAERLYRMARAVLDQAVFPDVRGEWLPFASKELGKLIVRNGYDCIVGSHEPAVDLMLAGRTRRSTGIRIIADMGDPIATPYSPKWRYRFDRFMEGRILRKFDDIVVTSARAAEELASRHTLDIEKFHVIPQGTSLLVEIEPSQPCRNLLQKIHNRFTVLYTGNFYRHFRDPDEVLKALTHLDTVHFILVGSEDRGFTELPNVEIIPRMGHFDCLHLQRACSVLLSLGNKQQEQTPGKVMEYLGAGRPILHVFQAPDFGAELVSRLNRGVAVRNEALEIEKAIRQLHAKYRAGLLESDYDLGPGSIAQYSWDCLARSYLRLIKPVAGAGLQ